MANVLDDLILDPDTAIYSPGIMGINGQYCSVDDTSVSWLTDKWFPAYSGRLGRYLNHWTDASYIGFNFGERKYGWIYDICFGWCYFVPDVYKIYDIYYWDDRDAGFHPNFEDGMLSNLIRGANPGVWVWIDGLKEQYNIDKTNSNISFNSGWIYFTRDSVGYNSTHFNNISAGGSIQSFNTTLTSADINRGYIINNTASTVMSIRINIPANYSSGSSFYYQIDIRNGEGVMTLAAIIDTSYSSIWRYCNVYFVRVKIDVIQGTTVVSTQRDMYYKTQFDTSYFRY